MAFQSIFESAKWELNKFHGDSTSEKDLYEVIEGEWNQLVYGGASVLWEALIGNGTTTAGQALTFFNSTQSAIGVGDSTTAVAASQTALQGATSAVRFRKIATVTHADGTSAANNTVTYVSTFATTDANYAWNEWGLFNSATDGTGRMLNRVVQSLGTKTSAATWQLTVTLSLA